MRLRNTLLVLLMLAATACNPLGPAPTPTLVPQQLADAGMQEAALAAIQNYAQNLSYDCKTPSLSILDNYGDHAVVHATVLVRTKSGFPYEEYDTLMMLRKSGEQWTVDPGMTLAKLAWEQELRRGPLQMRSGAGFTVSIPAGWAGYVAAEKELTPTKLCGVGEQVLNAVPVLLAMPAGYSAENVPVILRGFQQCPRQASLVVLRQRYEDLRKTETDLSFERLEMAQIGGQPALVVVVTDENGTMLYDVSVMYKERQLEFTLQARAGQDVKPLLDVLNGMKFD